MALTRFSYGKGRAVSSDDPGLNESLPDILGRGLLLDRIPSHLPLVGHCQVDVRWCVFVRERGATEIRGMVLPEEHYAKAGFDPFVVAATHLRGQDVRDAVANGPVDPPPSGLADDSDEPLRAAYGFFLAGESRLRRGPYLSVLPAGLTPRLSPLTRLTVVGPSIGGKTDPPPDTKTLTTRRPESEPTPASPHVETRGLPIEEIPWRPAQKPAPPETEIDTETSTAPDSSWNSVTLDRGGDAAAADRPPMPDPTDAADLEERLRTIEHRATSTRRLLVAGPAIALLVGVVVGVVLETRVRRVAASVVPVTTIARGLGVEAAPEEVEAAIEAHLHDLSTVAVQSGAWQAVLERRGVERDIFLDHLVDLTSRQRELLSLAASSRRLTTLAAKAESLETLSPAAEDLVAISKRREDLASLADAVGALNSLAPVAGSLVKIAGSADDLAKLAENTENLNALAADRRDLEAVAGQQAALAVLAANSTALRTLAIHGADLMVFWERYGDAVQTLARQQQSLSSLAERHRTLARLVEKSPGLYALADNDALLQLVRRPDDVDRLVRLAQHADALLAGIEGSAGSGNP